jgi:hypothetical protein
MKHFIWILCKKYKEFSSNSIVKAVKESFIFNLFKALIIIMLMLLLVFCVKPKKAYIYAELEKSELSSLEYQAEELVIGDINSNYVSISSWEKIILDLEGLTINGIDCLEGDCLVIYPFEHMPGYMSFSGVIDQVYLYDVNSNSNQYKIIYSGSSTYRFIGEQHIKIDYGTAYLIKENGEKIEIDNTKDIVLIDTLIKDIINEHQRLADEITNDDGSIKKEHETEYQNYTHIIDTFNNNEAYSVQIYMDSSEKDSDIKLEHGFIDFGTIESKHTNSCKVVANGVVDISYTPNSDEYILKKQEIYLNSSNALLNISYNTGNNLVFISGYVNDATLSQMSLFPNFWNWYFSNMYMVPLTLISSVFTALSMMNALKKR